MAEEVEQFVATGPIEASTGSEPDFTAFATGWTEPQHDYGANIQGRTCGVYADTLHGAEDENHRRQIPGHVPAGVGVCALGYTTGIHGETCTDGVGVQGRSTHMRGKIEGSGRGIGVKGEGAGRGVVGVAYPHRADDRGFPVGVLGAIAQALADDLPSDVPEGGAGVVGFGGKQGTGVVGQSSNDSAGVAGQNVRGGPGAAFSSAEGAQLRLEPTLKALPYEGSVGALLALVDDDSPDPVASLWFCTRRSTPNRPACWRRVAFDASSGGCD